MKTEDCYDVCKGLGYIWHKHYQCVVSCSTCHCTGKLNWIEKVFGKPENEGICCICGSTIKDVWCYTQGLVCSTKCADIRDKKVKSGNL